MRLLDFKPLWLNVDGKRVGFVFLCPHCQRCRLSCFGVAMPRISGDDPHESQCALFAQALGSAYEYDTVPCKPGFAWTFNPPIDVANFETLTITPSLDASHSGHWHGHITNGEIV
jgi:hypothetical protein